MVIIQKIKMPNNENDRNVKKFIANEIYCACPKYCVISTSFFFFRPTEDNDFIPISEQKKCFNLLELMGVYKFHFFKNIILYKVSFGINLFGLVLRLHKFLKPLKEWVKGVKRKETALRK